jgi:hypothetical protein
MHRANLRWFQAVAALFAFAVPLLPQGIEGDEPLNRQSLKGITSVRVLIGIVPSDAVADGLNENQFRTDVELRLRKAGVNVLAPDSVAPFLYVHVTLLKNLPLRLYTYDVVVSLTQVATVSNGTSLFAQTWNGGELGTAGITTLNKELRDRIGDLVDKFLNAYLSVNPK